MGKKRRWSNIEEKIEKNSVTIMVSVDVKEIVFPIKLKSEEESFEKF